MVYLLPLLFFAALCSAQEGDFEAGNEFDFAVALQYDVEPEVIMEGVGGALDNWSHVPDDTESRFSSLATNRPPQIWTNYDTNGVPPEIFGDARPSTISTNALNVSAAGRLGMSGVQGIVNANSGTGDRVISMPYISGTSDAPTRDFRVIHESFIPETFSLAQLRTALRVTDLPAGWIRNTYDSMVTGMYDFLVGVLSYGDRVRGFVAQLCTSVALLHLIWASAIVGSGIFRAVVAGLTGVSGGGK